jgi:hypothetical protein
MNLIDLKQPSTWRGLIGITSLIGLSLHPDLVEQIAIIAAALFSLIEIFRREPLAPPPARPVAPPDPQPLHHATRLPADDQPTLPGFNDR